MMTNVKEVQQALKEKGHDPGPVDGAMGTRTKKAIRSFQSANNLTPSGTINAETAEKLGVKANSSPSSSRPRAGSPAGDNMKSNDTTVGKDTDQPNQTPSKNK
jgi:peptidoglycan hydrolase-like protein with peptidoglycan-binding domain